jgi:hypothetical protein
MTSTGSGFPFPSFPRKRESRLCRFAPLLPHWMPAFAGMTDFLFALSLSGVPSKERGVSTIPDGDTKQD